MRRRRAALAFALLAAARMPAFDARVASVVDGDTVRLSTGETVRYLGLDAPESGQPWSREATRFNRRLVLGKTVSVEACGEKPRDSYGRLLAVLSVGGKNVSEELLRAGLATALLIPPCSERHYRRMLALQAEARRSRAGLWRDVATIPAEKALLQLGRVAGVEGRVRNIHRSEKFAALNFGEDWRRDFTITIFAASFPHFGGGGFERAYAGRRVRVFGRVREYNGPQIVVDYPEQIEILESGGVR